jgi:hypothetical protein
VTAIPTADSTRQAGPPSPLSQDQAARHIEMLTGLTTTPIHARLIHDSSRDALAFKLHGAVSELWPEIEARQAEGYGAFVVVNEGGHSDAEITRVRALFIDADKIPRPADWHAKPDFLIVRDALHWHAYWRVHDLPVAGFKAAQQRLAARYGSDRAVCNPSRVMRLAGTLHQKIAA